jgi:serine/threonine protein kinase
VTLAQIGRFEVERMLGTGSFATVWLARDEDLDAWVAIKLLADNWSLNEDARRRFMEEARALRQLDNDRIVRVYEVGRLPDDRPYMVMEYADRGSLEERIRLRSQLDQPFSLREAVTLGIEITECLAAVHDLRIVHRDVKPSNILFRSLSRERQDALRREGRPAATERTLLGDFGIARRLEGILGHTKVVGSPQYMAPEQADPERAQLVDERSDVFAAAVLLYELLAGRVPERRPPGRPDAEVGPVIDEVRPDIPDDLAEAVHRALAMEPEDRFPSAWAFRDALREAMDALPEWDGTPGVVWDRGATPARRLQPPSGGGTTTLPEATRKRTAVLPDEEDEYASPVPMAAEAVPIVAVRPEGTSTDLPSPSPAPAPRVAPDLGVRPHAFVMAAAGLAVAISLFVPMSSQRNVGGLTGRVGDISVSAVAVIAVSGLALMGTGVLLWRTRRRWAGRMVAIIGLFGGLIGLGAAGWVAVSEFIAEGGGAPEPGLYLLAAAASVGSLAASVAAGRLQPPLPIVRETGR